MGEARTPEPGDPDSSSAYTAEDTCGPRQVGAGSGGWGAIAGRRVPWERSGVLVGALSWGELTEVCRL